MNMNANDSLFARRPRKPIAVTDAERGALKQFFDALKDLRAFGWEPLNEAPRDGRAFAAVGPPAPAMDGDDDGPWMAMPWMAMPWMALPSGNSISTASKIPAFDQANTANRAAACGRKRCCAARFQESGRPNGRIGGVYTQTGVSARPNSALPHSDPARDTQR